MSLNSERLSMKDVENRLKVFKGRKRIKIPAEWNKLRE
jgi:hypothetical protein